MELGASRSGPSLAAVAEGKRDAAGSILPAGARPTNAGSRQNNAVAESLGFTALAPGLLSPRPHGSAAPASGDIASSKTQSGKLPISTLEQVSAT
jgi:hypothetical protein